MTFPLWPLRAIDMAGGALVILFSVLSFRLSIKLYRADRENIFSLYLLYLSFAYTVFAFSRGIGHILQHILVVAGHRQAWEAANPISGSLNTLSFFFVGTVSLFFIAVQHIYEKMALDKKRIEEINLELMNLNRDMESIISERTLSMIALSIADSIRNPAIVIGATAKRVLKAAEGLSGPLRERLMDFLAESQKLDAIVKDYEMILRSRQTVFTYEDLNDLMRGMMPFIEKDLREKAINFSLNLPDAPLKFNANRQLIRVAIIHILKNAIEATPPGARITVSAGRTDEHIYLAITDSGPGIAPEDIPKIFSLFYSTKKHRIGMGLPLVKQIVDEHKGEIQVESRLGEGSTFRMLFPVRWK